MCMLQGTSILLYFISTFDKITIPAEMFVIGVTYLKLLTTAQLVANYLVSFGIRDLAEFH